jgi:hypothetical protein
VAGQAATRLGVRPQATARRATLIPLLQTRHAVQTVTAPLGNTAWGTRGCVLAGPVRPSSPMSSGWGFVTAIVLVVLARVAMIPVIARTLNVTKAGVCFLQLGYACPRPPFVPLAAPLIRRRMSYVVRSVGAQPVLLLTQGPPVAS